MRTETELKCGILNIPMPRLFANCVYQLVYNSTYRSLVASI